MSALDKLLRAKRLAEGGESERDREAETVCDNQKTTTKNQGDVLARLALAYINHGRKGASTNVLDLLVPAPRVGQAHLRRVLVQFVVSRCRRRRHTCSCNPSRGKGPPSIPGVWGMGHCLEAGALKSGPVFNSHLLLGQAVLLPQKPKTMRALFLLGAAVLALALDPHTLFYEVRTDLSNDTGNLSFFSMNLLAPSEAPKLAGSLNNVPGATSCFGIDPVRDFLYFDIYQFFDHDHEGMLFGRFSLATPTKIEHLLERTLSEPGGLRVAPGSRIGETYFVTCVEDPVSGNHSSVVLHVFDNGDLDTRNVATFSPDMIDDKACHVPVAFANQEPNTLFIAGSK